MAHLAVVDGDDTGLEEAHAIPSPSMRKLVKSVFTTAGQCASIKLEASHTPGS